MSDEFTDRERSFLVQSVRRRNLFLVFSILSVAAALLFLVYHGLIIRDLNALRSVVVLLLLLSGRSHLRQYRSALIFSKLKSRLGL